MSIKSSSFYITVAFSFCVNLIYSQKSNPASITKWSSSPFEQKVFVENAGQLDGVFQNKNIQFSARSGKIETLFSPQGVIWKYTEVKKSKEEGREERKERSGKISERERERENLDKINTSYLEMEWIGSNPNVTIEKEEQVKLYYTYKIGGRNILAHAYSKIIYKNLYPGVDVEYILPKEKNGIKYNLIVSAGADISKIKMRYKQAKKLRIDESGNVVVTSKFGEFIDHAPISYYKNTDENIPSSFELKGDEVSFNIGKPNPSETIIIDPWVVAPGYASGPSAFDVNYDDAGNVLAYGSVFPFELVKFDNAGAPQWIYTLVTGTSPRYGTFTVDMVTGFSYLGQGKGGPFIHQIDPSGNDLGTCLGDPDMNEVWRMEWDRVTNLIYLAGGNGSNQAGTIDPTSMVRTSDPIAGHDMQFLALDPCLAKTCYMSGNTHDLWGMNLGSFASPFFTVPNNYTNPYSYVTREGSDGINGMAASPSFLYTYDGNLLIQYDKSTGALLNKLVVPGVAIDYEGGLDVDDCDNIYVGANNSVQVFDVSLNPVTSYGLPSDVFDVKLDKKNNMLYACGLKFVTAIDLPPFVTAVTQTPSCFGACSGIASATVTSCSSPTYSWSPGGMTTPVVTGLCPGTYTVEMTFGCTTVVTETITVTSYPMIPITTAISILPSCASPTGAIVVTAPIGVGYEYNKNGGAFQSSPTFSGLAPGSYSITARDIATGCSSSVSVQTLIGGGAAPSLTLTPSFSLCSGSSSTLTVTGGVTYTWSPASGLSSISGGTVIATPTITTTYTVLSGTTPCTASAVVTITVSPTPTISVNSGTICSGSSFTMIPAGAVNYTYAGGSAIVSPTTTTTYTVRGSSLAGCVSSAVTSTVTVNPTPTISVNSGTICSGSSFTLVPGGAVSYTYAGGSAVVSPTTTTTYTIQGTSAAGCISNMVTSTITVIANPTITVNSGTICSGQSFTIVPAGAMSYTYASGSAVVSPTITTTYTVQGSNATGCLSNIITSTITVNTTPTITVNSGTICSGQSFTMVPAGAVSYTYAGGSAIVSPTATTTYTVIGSGALGCVSSAVTSTVTVNPTPTISVNSGTICSGSSFTMVPVGAVSYTYAGGSSVVSPTTTSSYTVQGTSAAGCISNMVTSTITVIPNPTITVNSGTICSGQSFTIIPAGAMSYTYAGGSAVVSPTITTTYTVQGSNATGCLSNIITSTITVNTTPTITVNSGTICSGQSFTIVPVGAVSYTYAGGSAVVIPTTTTTYTVNGSGASGCISSAVTSTVTVSPNISITVNSGTICSGSSFTMVPLGALTYTYSGGSAVVSPTTTTTYTIQGTSSAGCISSIVTSTLLVNPTPTIIITPPIVAVCPGSTVNFSASGAVSYTWSPSSSLSSPFGTAVTAFPRVSTTYTIVGMNGVCTNSTLAAVIILPDPTVTVTGNTVICSGQSTTLTVAGADHYTWVPGTYLNIVNGTSVISSPSISTTYTVFAFSSDGCIVPVAVPISVIPTPTLSLAVTPSVICEGESAALSAFGASTYSWSPSFYLSSVSANPTTVSPTITTTYTLEGFNHAPPNYCVSTKTIQVKVIPKIIAKINPISPLCVGQSTTLKASGGDTYSWTPAIGLSKPTSSITTVQTTVNTSYTVTVSQKGSCPTQATINIVVVPVPIVDAGKDTSVQVGESVTLIGKGNVTVGFQPIDGPALYCNYCSSIMVSPQTNTCYRLRGENSFGCVSYDDVCVRVIKDWDVYIPNTFTPNGDGINEYFIPVGYGIDYINLTIFDRWGTQLFKEEKTTKGWDGKYQGKVCKQDVYVYLVELKTMEGNLVKKTGQVNVLPLVK